MALNKQSAFDNIVERTQKSLTYDFFLYTFIV